MSNVKSSNLKPTMGISLPNMPKMIPVVFTPCTILGHVEGRKNLLAAVLRCVCQCVFLKLTFALCKALRILFRYQSVWSRYMRPIY